jgi:adenosylcobinamide-phosphate synthase
VIKVRQFLEWMPARCLALTYALLGDRSRAMGCWREYASVWSDTNNGVLIATGSGSLGVSVGGSVLNDETTRYRPILGDGPAPKIKDVERATRMIIRGVWLWLAVIFLVELI